MFPSKLKRLSLCLFLLFSVAGICLFPGCDSVSETAFSSRRYGISFDFPEGWSEVKKSEEDYPENGSVVTIADSMREGFVSLIDLPFSDRELEDLTDFGDLVGSFVEDDSLSDDEKRVATFLMTMIMTVKNASSRKYQNYKLIKDDIVAFAQRPAGEVICSGNIPDKAMRQTRFLILLQRSKVLMLIFSAPIDEVSEYQTDFNFVENTWEWK